MIDFLQKVKLYDENESNIDLIASGADLGWQPWLKKVAQYQKDPREMTPWTFGDNDGLDTWWSDYKKIQREGIIERHNEDRIMQTYLLLFDVKSRGFRHRIHILFRPVLWHTSHMAN